MQYVCDAPKGKTWFRIETEGEAAHESRLMSHTVEKYFRRERDKAIQSWRPERPNAIERDIGLEAHVQREMPLFLTLRDREGNALTTAMLPPGGKDRGLIGAMSAHGPSVWTGRALQAESDDLEVVGLALLYPALDGTFEFLAIMDIRARSISFASRPRRP